MKFKSLLFINFHFLFFVFLNLNINFNEAKVRKFTDLTNRNSFTPYHLFLNENFYNNNQINSNVEPEIQERMINLEQVQTELIYSENIYIFTLNETDNLNEKDYLINFYPLDCHIRIEVENSTSKINIIEISNYKYNSYFLIIPKNETNFVKIKIKSLITSYSDYFKKRTFHLLINSFAKEENPILNIMENNPVFLYFNNNFDNITLLYEFNKTKTNKIVVSFFIKERVKFDVEVQETGINKTISYIDNILILPDNLKYISSKINITIKNLEKGKDAVMIAKIVENHLVPKYLQKDILNLEFFPSRIECQHFYMEVFKGEEGEIVLNSKKFDGFLVSKIIKRDNIFEEKIPVNDFPNENNKNNFIKDLHYLAYYEYEQKLIFNSSQTKECSQGCYLLLTYYSKPLKNVKYILGGEFTLLAKIWDEEEFSPQIINIPLNEYIFGTFNYKSVKQHYYSVFIPENTESIIIEIQKNNNLFEDIDFFAKEGIVKINNYKLTEYTYKLNDLFEEKNNDKTLIELNCKLLGLNNFEKKYISLAFEEFVYNDENFISSYYFRIIQRNSTNNFIIYPLDINKPNLCQTSLINEKYSCFFVIRNDYSELSNNFSVYAYGKKKITYYNWTLLSNETDYYSIKLDEWSKEANHSENEKSLEIFNASKSSYVLIKIESSFKEVITIITNFYNSLPNSLSLQTYSYKLFYLKDRKQLDFKLNYILYNKYRVLLNVTKGTGNIRFYQKNSVNKKSNVKITQSNLLSFIVSNNTEKISIKSEGYLLINVKIDYIIDTGFLKELNHNNELSSLEQETFPLAYYLKESDNEAVIINFNFNFESYDALFYKYIEPLKISASITDFDVLNYIDNEDTLLSIYQPVIDGKYDVRKNQGLLILEKGTISNYLIGKDRYYLIFIKNYIKEQEDPIDFSLEIIIFSKDSSQFLLPLNKYISGSFDLKNNNLNQKQKYYFKPIDFDDDDGTNNLIIEFSSNYEYIDIIFNNNTILCKDIKKEGGITKYYINISPSDSENNENYFEVVLLNITNRTENKEEYLKTADYTIRCNINNNTQEDKYIFDLFHTFERTVDNNYELTIKNKYENKNVSEDNEFVYFLDIYEKNKILKDELINTIVLTHSEKLQEYYLNPQKSFIEFKVMVDFLMMNKEYVFSLFIRIQNNETKEHKDYYTYSFSYIPKDIKTKNNNLLIILLSAFGVLFIILIIIFLYVYRRIRRKNKNLKEQVQALSFSSGIEDQLDKEEKKKKQEDEDYETTFI